jgi:hypothetical protein
MWCNKVVAMRVFINFLNILNIAHFHVCTKHGCCLHCSAEKVQSFMKLTCRCSVSPAGEVLLPIMPLAGEFAAGRSSDTDSW